MVRQMVSRTERRMEKKQALILLLLVLGVSLVSFVLGVMVGRGGSRQQPPPEVAETKGRVPVPVETPAAGNAGGSVDKPQEAPAPLTFYDTLPKGEQPPLGSGINRPPQPRAEEIPASSPAPPDPAPTKATAAARPEATRPTPPLPEPAASQGSYVLQVASFKAAGDAEGLRSRLAAKGYPAYQQQADLGPKGTWTRVMVGPYADSSVAGRAAERLKAEEKLSPLVKKR